MTLHPVIASSVASSTICPPKLAKRRRKQPRVRLLHVVRMTDWRKIALVATLFAMTDWRGDFQKQKRAVGLIFDCRAHVRA